MHFDHYGQPIHRKLRAELFKLALHIDQILVGGKQSPFSCVGQTYPRQPLYLLSIFPTNIPIILLQHNQTISIHMLACSWIAYSSRVNLTSALQLQCYQKFCRNLSIFPFYSFPFCFVLFFLNTQGSFPVPQICKQTGKVAVCENDKRT